MAANCVSYYPSEADTQTFWNREATREKAPVEPPSGFPKEINSSLAWTHAEVVDKQSDWTLDLASEDVVAIEAALAAFEANYTDLSSISASTFELPVSLSRRLRQISDQLYSGVGFQIVHGLDPSKYTSRQNIIIYAGVGAHVCPQRGFVDIAGEEVVAHIVNVQGDNLKVKPEPKAPGFSNVPLSFHTDYCEIMAFYYLDTALKGGLPILTSSWQTYNELAARRPEVLHTLAELWVLDTYKPYALAPVRHVRLLETTDADKVLLRFSRYPFTGWQHKRNPDLPAPTRAQLEALDAVQFMAAMNSITLPVVKGDMLFANDMVLMHARQGFDEGGVYMKRHLLKMFLRDPEKDWAISPSVEKEREKMYGPNRPDGTREELWHIVYEDGCEESKIMNG